MHSIQKHYGEKKELIEQQLEKFKSLASQSYFDELLFCLLTPGSNAQRCWKAVQELKALKHWNTRSITPLLAKRTRFHNMKTQRVLKARKDWKKIQSLLVMEDRKTLRNTLAQEVNGLGLKEASHFLRNIGKSDNQIAILDRHILKHLHLNDQIDSPEIRSPKHYLDIEQKFIAFSRSLNIPIDHLDLLFWSEENGEVFK